MRKATLGQACCWRSSRTPASEVCAPISAVAGAGDESASLAFREYTARADDAEFQGAGHGQRR